MNVISDLMKWNKNDLNLVELLTIKRKKKQNQNQISYNEKQL